MKTTDKQLMLIKQILDKKKADVTLSIVNPSEGRYIATCRIVDDVGRSVSASVDLAQYNSKSKGRASTEDIATSKVIKKSFEKYLELLTVDMRLIIEENGLRTSEVLDTMEKALKCVIEKSKSGEEYIADFNVGKQNALKVIISTQEIGKIKISLRNNNGIVIFEEKGITADEPDAEACILWLYARCENCF